MLIVILKTDQNLNRCLSQKLVKKFKKMNKDDFKVKAESFNLLYQLLEDSLIGKKFFKISLPFK